MANPSNSPQRNQTTNQPGSQSGNEKVSQVEKVAGDETVAIVLAAGFSKRFGSDKRFHPLQLSNKETVQSKPLLQATLDSIVPQFQHIVVVHRFEDEDILALLKHYPVNAVAAPKAPIGLGVSLATAAKYILEKTQPPKRLMVFLGDMPNIKHATIEQLLAQSAKSPDAVVRPRYQGKSGHPVCLPATFLKALTSLNRDEGAAALIQTSNCPVLRVDVNDSGVLFDIDTPEQSG
ncbi:NTP transferase domain-containing protein [Thalassotalea sp. PS06]|uniref:nucleotidyltransferase family protein n=1 Tax=Thalassotalea sp. PS06 TaxID=2594005 RepID=UPI001164BD85|nr:nucleotidyltransferase family protein [Thalassotalea sp. PS06]QDP00978.1 nucleotidyltransferase family protein [Thalassotalea sp. PS06]